MSIKWYRRDGSVIDDSEDEFAGFRYFEQLDRRVAADHAWFKMWRVSTVFLGIDHSYWPDGPPLLYETMVFHTFGEGCDFYVRRYTYEFEAVEGHQLALHQYRKLRYLPYGLYMFVHFSVRLLRRRIKWGTWSPLEELKYVVEKMMKKEKEKQPKE